MVDFEQKRSTTDQISSLISIIDTRKKRKLSTFAALIDFKKACDFISRDNVGSRISNLGISSKMLNAVKSLYTL